ncbi:hypothetical protein F8R89_26560 [Streptomyces sp. SS1-1]|uniref:hypothetical protein n=1 Tax=Streptomyces sp. SS1-1 TaxID=2651869 RepID=UPI0012508A7E|nr:hypothetical protein [Streptomyces sp. SS1-1]KAB2975249.1 hypothetical protein F8R89_26560 [Streptomyces sp. SS1-1]
MERRHLLTAPAALAAALALVSGCASGDDASESPGRPASSASPDGARQAVAAYVEALNSRSASRLIAVGGVEDEKWSRQEAARILAERGGRGWRIEDVRIEHDMGPDTGSARLKAMDKAGEAWQDTFTVTRDKGAWHLVVFTHQPGEPGKETAATGRPTS